ncbi:hypothetical protein N7466_006664 [Penicillium verhagenii]|nr:hypothetical protein N7466_006664 [Penicillium verhagenii]
MPALRPCAGRHPLHGAASPGPGPPGPPTISHWPALGQNQASRPGNWAPRGSRQRPGVPRGATPYKPRRHWGPAPRPSPACRPSVVLSPRRPRPPAHQLAAGRGRSSAGRGPRAREAPPSKRPALPGPLMGRCKTNKSSQGRADAQRLVATRLLDRVHDPLGHFSRLQRIYPRAR